MKCTAIKLLSNVSTPPLASGCLATSTPWKCGYLRASGQPRGCKGYPNNKLTGKKPAIAIKEKKCLCQAVNALFTTGRKKRKILPPLVRVRYLYQPGELEGGVKRAWSFKVYGIERSFTKENQPVLYYLRDGPKRGFVREELLVVPPNSELLPEKL